MFEYFREILYSDKVFENKVLGKVSCAAFGETLRECKQVNKTSKNVDICVEVRQMTDQCYMAKDVD